MIIVNAMIKDNIMCREDKKLKCYLILQSFCPLLILMFVKHFDDNHFELVLRFFTFVFEGDFSVFSKAINNSAIGDVIISFLSVLWVLLTVLVAIGFRDVQTTNLDSHGENITNVVEINDSGATYLMTFILPLLVDDVSTIRGMIFFAVLFIMVIFLLIKSNLVYQSPILALFNYKVFEFQFMSPHGSDIDANKTYIGLSRDSLPSSKRIIKRRYIADNVFLVYND